MHDEKTYIMPAGKVQWMKEAIELLKEECRKAHADCEFDGLNHKDEGRYLGYETALSFLIEQHPAGVNGWVKARAFIHEIGVPYHAKDSKSKGAGRFNKDGAFVWGDGTLTWPEHSDDLFILDESPNEQPVEQISQDAHEKEVMMKAFGKVRQIFEGRQWVMEGRGSYPYNDDRYREEVRYMYDEFDALVKDTWGNIKSHSSEYRQAIITDYLKGEQKENEAVAFMKWSLESSCMYSATDEDQWTHTETNENITTVQLYNEYQKQKNDDKH